MKYLLDSSIIIALLHRDRGRTVLPRLEVQPRGAVATSAIVAHELYFGVARSAKRDENRRKLTLALADFEVLPYTREDAEVAGEVRAALKGAGTPIGPYDVLIAGQALARGLVLVTNNGREFERVQGLAIEDWLRPDGTTAKSGR